MEPIRILNLFTNMNRGGAETVVMNYYRHIDRSRVQFDFMVHREKRGTFEDEIESLGGKVFRMPPIKITTLQRYKENLKEFFTQHKEYRIIHGHMSELGAFAYKAAKDAGIPIRICHAHNTRMETDRKTLFRLYLIWLCKKHITHRFSCGKNAARWFYGDQNQEEIVIMNNAVDSKTFRFDATKSQQIKKELGIEDKLAIGHIGRFNTQKNHEFIIEIFKEIHDIDNQTVLLLAGEGELQERIKQKVKMLGIENSVMFLGMRNDIESLINGFDVFLLPSLFEGLPVTLIEAQSNGLKCFVSQNVPTESNLTGNVEFISLNKKASYWGEKILSCKAGYERKNFSQEIERSGFEITKEAPKLCELYLNYYRKSLGI